MKRFMALFLSAILLTAVFPAASALAADKKPAVPAVSAPASGDRTKPLLGKDSLEEVVSLVRSRLDIPQAFTEFSSNVYDSGGKTEFRLRWSNSDSYSPVSGSVELTVDENGAVKYYYNYSYDKNYDYSRRLPRITVEQAAERARKFLANMCPDIAGQISYDIAIQKYNIQYDGGYVFNFYRLANGIPYYENSVYLQVDGRTGNVTNMSRNWDDSLVFPAPDNIITMEKAKEAWKKEIGLKPAYRFMSAQGGVKPTLRYSPAVTDMLYAIDAVTGGKMAVDTMYNPYMDYGYRYNGNTTSISGTEIDEIKQLKGLIDADRAEKLARGMTELGMDDTYRLNGYVYNSTGDGNYTLQLEFRKEASKETLDKNIPPEKLKAMIAAGEGGGSAVFSFDAGTGELISFNLNGYNAGTSQTGGLSRKEMQKTAGAFLEKYKAPKFKQAELAESAPYMNDYMMKFGMAGADGNGYFIYNRKVNGITVQDNSMSVNVDAATGRITAYSEAWDNAEFPPADGIISPDRAYEVLFGQDGLELKYAAEADPANPNGVSAGAGSPAPRKLKLVYAPGNGRPTVVDALKGVLIDGGTGEEYTDRSVASYDDLAGNPYGAYIEKLARASLLPLEKSFRPDGPALQKDFLRMLSLFRGGMPGISEGELAQTAQDGMYRQLMNDGILDEDEKEPDAAVTKIQAVKFLLRAAGYGKFAEMKGIFDCSYADKAGIAPDLLGYAAIAGSLGIVKESAFEPGKKLTRAEAAMLIYRYMDR